MRSGNGGAAAAGAAPQGARWNDDRLMVDAIFFRTCAGGRRNRVCLDATPAKSVSAILECRPRQVSVSVEDEDDGSRTVVRLVGEADATTQSLAEVLGA